MPPRKQPSASHAPRTYTRRCKLGGGAGYRVRMVGPSGAVVLADRFAHFGDEMIGLDAPELMRLESVGAAGAEDQTRADLEAEAERRLAAYREQRRSTSGIV